MSVTCGSPPEGFSLFTTDFPPEEFPSRRFGSHDAIGTSALELIQADPAPCGYTRSRQSNELFYLCGIERLHRTSFWTKCRIKQSSAFRIEMQDGNALKGRYSQLKDEALIKHLADVDVVYGLEMFLEYLAAYARGNFLRTSFTSSDSAERCTTNRLFAVHPFADARPTVRWPAFP